MIKFKRLNWEFVQKNYPILYETIENEYGRLSVLSEIDKECIAGLCLEVALQSDGTPSIFSDELDVEPEDEWDEIID